MKRWKVIPICLVFCFAVHFPAMAAKEEAAPSSSSETKCSPDFFLETLQRSDDWCFPETCETRECDPIDCECQCWHRAVTCYRFCSPQPTCQATCDQQEEQCLANCT